MPSPVHEPVPELSIVLPCLNEAETLGAAIAEAQAALTLSRIAGEVIVADNGSTDGSREIALAGGARIVSVSERGYGVALMGGMAAARAPYVIYADCDGSYDFRQSYRLLASLLAGADLVLGSRFPAGGGKIDRGAMPWLHRYFGTPALTLACRLLYGVKITDINSGMRGVRLSAFSQLRVMGTGMEFASEIVLQMARHGFRIREVPITLRKDGRSRRPHLRTWRDGWRHLCILLVYSPSALFLVPGGLLAICGGIALAALAPNAVVIDNVGFSNNTRIVAALATLAGTQIFLLGLLAKYMAHVQQVFEPNARFIHRVQQFFRIFAIPVGGLLFLIGLGTVIYVFGHWSETHFGPFDAAHADRILAPAATVSVFGLQLIVIAFFSMLLDIVRR